MASKNDKNMKQEPYDDPGWGDSITVSRKARKELKEITGKDPVQQNTTSAVQGRKAEIRAKNQPVVNKTTSLAKAIDSSINAPENAPVAKVNQELRKDVNEQVEKLNQEFDNAVNQIENVFDRFFNSIGTALNHLLLAIYNLFLKILLIIFIEPIKHAGEISNMFVTSMNKGLSDFSSWLTSDSKPVRKNTFDNNYSNANYSRATKPQTQSLPQQPQQHYAEIPKPKKPEIQTIQERYPHVFYGVIFGHLAKKGIIFLDIKNRSIYEEGAEFTVEEEQELLETAVKEIASCSKLARNLPCPTKGKFANKDMSSVLENATIVDLKEFLMYVDNHPKPFLERKLRLSEAFATWAHKGAPL